MLINSLIEVGGFVIKAEVKVSCVGRQKKKRKARRMLMAPTPASSVRVLLLQGHLLIESIHAKQPNKEAVFASDPALITAYMPVGQIQQGVLTETGLLWGFLGGFF